MSAGMSAGMSAVVNVGASVITRDLPGYLRAWADVMPLAHAIGFIAHDMTLAAATAAYEACRTPDGSVDLSPVEMVWALADADPDLTDNQTFNRKTARTPAMACLDPITA